MSFVQNGTGKVYTPGWFLAEEVCSRETRTIPVTHAQVETTDNGGKYVPMGAFYPANSSSTVEGIVYEDVDVTTGAMPGSVVTKGVVYLDRLPAAPESGVQSALEAKGFKFYASVPSVSRPNFEADSLTALTVASAAGTAVGDTKITVSGYTPGPGEGYKYKVGDTAESVVIGQNVSAWTAWDGTSDITAATDKKITMVVADSTGAAVAAGNATVTAKA